MPRQQSFDFGHLTSYKSGSLRVHKNSTMTSIFESSPNDHTNGDGRISSNSMEHLRAPSTYSSEKHSSVNRENDVKRQMGDKIFEKGQGIEEEMTEKLESSSSYQGSNELMVRSLNDISTLQETAAKKPKPIGEDCSLNTISRSATVITISEEDSKTC